MTDMTTTQWADQEAIPEPANLAILPTVKNLASGENIITPNAWLQLKFPNLGAAHGEPLLEQHDPKSGELKVTGLCEDFLAATLGEQGAPEAPTVFVPREEQFYRYDPLQGIYGPVREAELSSCLSHLLLLCARESEGANMKSLEFKFRKTQELKGAIERARGVLAVADSFFDVPLTEFIACRNGMLSLPEMRLHPFSPTFRRRNKLSVEYNPVAECPLFLETLLRPALNDDDIDLLQRWSGMVLTGTNLAQKLMFVTGVGGGGKGSLIRVLIGVIGNTNIASLRTKHLHERFELSRLFGKTLLYGADVDENFLNTPGASVLKSLTGGDPVTVEFKLSNETPGVVCRFNAVVTCNSLPQIRFEGDTSAWRRRLAIVRFGKQSAEPEITDLSEQILAKEGAGVLNWMLEGLRKLLAEGWRLKMTDDQRLVVDDLLGESDSAGAFVGGRLRADNDALLTVGGCYTAYVAFCAEREWREMSRKAFGNVIGALVSRQFGLTLRHDIEGADSTPQRGWKGVEVI